MRGEDSADAAGIGDRAGWKRDRTVSGSSGWVHPNGSLRAECVGGSWAEKRMGVGINRGV